jgi:hypothetical protein
MTESVGNETIEKGWCFLSRNWHCGTDWIFELEMTLKTFLVMSVTFMLCYCKNEPLAVNFNFA